MVRKELHLIALMRKRKRLWLVQKMKVSIKPRLKPDSIVHLAVLILKAFRIREAFILDAWFEFGGFWPGFPLGNHLDSPSRNLDMA